MARGVPFYTAAHGVDVDTFTLHIHATVGEQERRLIGQRTNLAGVRSDIQTQTLKRKAIAETVSDSVAHVRKTLPCSAHRLLSGQFAQLSCHRASDSGHLTPRSGPSCNTCLVSK